MDYKKRKQFKFVSQAMSKDTFGVVSFKGSEGISKLYEFDITLASDDPDIDLKTVLQSPGVLSISREDTEDRLIHGILSKFEQLHEVEQHVFYRAVLVPRLWQADLYHENQLFLDKTIPDIIKDVLQQTGLTGADYEMKLTKQYPEWEYICQYRETDFDFISRWMEREGIYYYFEQTKQFEKLIITDSITAHQDIPGESTVYYSPPSGLIPKEEEIVRNFSFQQERLPNKVILKDYNYRKPSLELKGEANIDPKGQGTVYIYGEHFKSPQEGNDLAKIRAEEFLCREKIFRGKGTAPMFNPGFLYELADHYRESNNQKYLITEVEHEGSQAGVFLTGVQKGTTGKEEDMGYVNNFVAIPEGIQFRPERKTVKPRFHGTINAHVDAAGDGQYAEIDDQGRYKVKLPFDMSGKGGGKASRWVRMIQPYAGADYGMHFPLHKNIEVLLTLVDGDPDRPIITGSVPNPQTGSPVTASNQTKSIIRTGGGNEIHFEDNKGKEELFVHAKKDKKSVIENELTELVKSHAKQMVMGKLKEIVKKQVMKLFKSDTFRTILGMETHVTKGTYIQKVGGSFVQSVAGNYSRKVGGNFKKEVEGDYTLEIKGNCDLKIDGDLTIDVAGKVIIKGARIDLNP